MLQSNLLELTYFDPKASVRLTTYADTIITEPCGREESIIAARFGGYPEMVRAMSDAIYGGGIIDLIQNGTTYQLKSTPKAYGPDGQQGCAKCDPENATGVENSQRTEVYEIHLEPGLQGSR